MKRFLKFLMIFILVIFILPALCTRKTIDTNANTEVNENNVSNSDNIPVYDYSKYGTIKLYHSKAETIEELPIDEYLYGVVSAEMPATYEMEALKAQAIVSRTYTLYQIINGKSKHGEAELCDDSKCCQAWISKDDRFAKWKEAVIETNWNKIVTSVKDTSGKIIVYDNKPIGAFFHSNSGGKTENVANVWGSSSMPYLQSVETSGENDYSQYSSEVVLKKDELLDKLKQKYNDISIDFNSEKPIEILEYTESKRVKTIKFGNTTLSGTETRSLLGLKSTMFSVNIDGDNVVFSVVGYGHGVGMSQTGADSMAKNGYNCDDIIKHFYTGVDIIFVNELK